MKERIKGFYDLVTGRDLELHAAMIQRKSQTLPDDYQQAFEKFSSITWIYASGSGRELLAMQEAVLEEWFAVAQEGRRKGIL